MSLAGCGGDDEVASRRAEETAAADAAAAVRRPPRDAPPSPHHPTPAILPSDLHLDQYGSDYEPRAPRRSRRDDDAIELLLRSTPPGAVASVDGERLGVTPVVWRGSARTQSLEVTFVLPGYSMARYRFVPLRSGIVHGTLHRVVAVPHDGGVPSSDGAGAPESIP